MPLTVAVQMDPIERIRIAGDFDLRLALGGAGERPQVALLYARTNVPESQPRDGERAAAGGQGRRRRPFEARRLHAHRSRGDRRGAVAPGPALRPRLCHDHPSPRAHSTRDPGRQRPPRGARRARKAFRHGLSRIDAADPDRQGARHDRGVSRRARRGRHEAAFRARRRLGFQDRDQGPEFRLALRSLQRHLPRALGGPEIPSRRRQGRQADHSRRRRGARRGQPGSDRRRHPLQHGSRRRG